MFLVGKGGGGGFLLVTVARGPGGGLGGGDTDGAFTLPLVAAVAY